MLLKSVSDICSGPTIRELEQIGYQLGLMNMMQIYLQVQGFEGQPKTISFLISEGNAFEEARKIFSLAIVNLACFYHTEYQVPAIEPNMAVSLTRSFDPKLHEEAAAKYLQTVKEICEKYPRAFVHSSI